MIDRAETRELLPAGRRRKPKTAEQRLTAARTGFDYPVTQVGVIGNVTIDYDPVLGAQGLELAQRMLTGVRGPYDDMQSFFGMTGAAVSVVIAPLDGETDGSAGAYHYGCDFTAGGVLYLDATFTNTTVNPLDLEIGLYVAELSEAFMGPQNRGWNCGYSNGEALSRFLAEHETLPDTLNAFATGPAWDQAGRPDWIDKTEPTDQDAVSTGCGMIFFYWMRALGFAVPQFVQAGGATLSANYRALTGKDTAYRDLLTALSGVTINSDNPFGAAAT
jgi:hypothetical protein